MSIYVSKSDKGDITLKEAARHKGWWQNKDLNYPTRLRFLEDLELSLQDLAVENRVEFKDKDSRGITFREHDICGICVSLPIPTEDSGTQLSKIDIPLTHLLHLAEEEGKVRGKSPFTKHSYKLIKSAMKSGRLGNVIDNIENVGKFSMEAKEERGIDNLCVVPTHALSEYGGSEENRMPAEPEIPNSDPLLQPSMAYEWRLDGKTPPVYIAAERDVKPVNNVTDIEEYLKDFKTTRMNALINTASYVSSYDIIAGTWLDKRCEWRQDKEVQGLVELMDNLRIVYMKSTKKYANISSLINYPSFLFHSKVNSLMSYPLYGFFLSAPTQDSILLAPVPRIEESIISEILGRITIYMSNKVKDEISYEAGRTYGIMMNRIENHPPYKTILTDSYPAPEGGESIELSDFIHDMME